MEFTTSLASGLCFLFLLGSVGMLGVRAAATTQSLAQPAPAPASSELTSEQRADIFMARRSYADALDCYARALRQQAGDKEALSKIWNKVGIADQQEDGYQAARKAYKQALRLNPNLAEAWNNLGTTYFFESKFKHSIKYYQHAIALDPDLPSFHVNLGTSYSRLKKYPQAVDEYRVALTLDPTVLAQHSPNGTVMQPLQVDADYYFYLAKVFASLGRAPESVRYLRHAFEDGFNNFKKLDQDPDFLKISKDPSYTELRNRPPVAIKD